MTDCIFCQLSNKPEIFIAENEDAYAIRDINPQKPIHILIIPKEHIASLNKVPSNSNITSQITALAQQIAKEYQISGYKFNCNVEAAGGQEVMHLHFHFLANSSEKSIA